MNINDFDLSQIIWIRTSSYLLTLEATLLQITCNLLYTRHFAVSHELDQTHTLQIKTELIYLSTLAYCLLRSHR